MKISDEEVFGGPEQQDLVRRGARLWRLMQGDKRFSYYGRMVSLAEPSQEAAPLVEALVALQGACSCQYLPADLASDLRAKLAEKGILTERYELLRGGDKALSQARAHLRARARFDGVRVFPVQADSPRVMLEKLAAFQLACGVLPVSGAVMRGLVRPSVCLLALNRKGEAVATVAAILSNHPDSALGTEAFWGLLATRSDYRGRGLGLWLGAQAMERAARGLGATSFFAGVRAENRASVGLCRKLGFQGSQQIVLACMDPDRFGEKALTK